MKLKRGKKTNKKTSEEDNTVKMSDEYLSESGVQGGKVAGEQLTLGSFIVGISFLIISLCMLFVMLFGYISPLKMAYIILVLLITVIGLLLTIGGYFIYRDKHVKN